MSGAGLAEARSALTGEQTTVPSLSGSLPTCLKDQQCWVRLEGGSGSVAVHRGGWEPLQDAASQWCSFGGAAPARAKLEAGFPLAPLQTHSG